MQDRIPLYPGRVKMTPVTGQANTFDMVRADDPTQAGTPLNKATLLKDATAALFGLGASTVPDDVLAELGKYKQYWWRRRELGHYVLQETSISAPRPIYVNSSSVVTYTYGSSVTINQTDGTVTINNPQTLTTQRTPNASVFDPLIGSYYMCDKPMRHPNTGQEIMLANTLYFIPDGTTIKNNGEGYYLATAAMKISTQKSAPGDWQYIQSSNRNAYPDSGTQDGYKYEYLGIPFDNAVTSPKIEVVSYMGTDSYGSGNKNTITFSFTPRFWSIFAYIPSNGNNIWPLPNFLPWGVIASEDHSIALVNTSYSGNTQKASYSGKTVTWYNSNSAGAQLNSTGTYYCIGIS